MGKKILYFLAALLVLTIVHSGAAQAKGQAGKLSFSDTGLLVHSGEDDAEILMRAHTMDPDAIALTVAGYSYGISGFPEAPAVAASWADAAARTGTAEDAAFLSAMSHHWSKNQKKMAPLLADCEFGQRSRFAPVFKQAGIFDIQARHEELSALSDSSQEWTERYQGRLDELRDNASFTSRTRALVLQLINRPATHEELELLKVYLDRDWYAVLYFVAALDGKKAGKQYWNMENLLNFTAMRYQDPDGGRETIANYSGWWIYLGMLLNDDPKTTLDLIRRAHTGDMAARRTMANNYILPSAMGFNLEPGLCTAWMVDSSSEGDEKSFMQSILYSYQQGEISFAWAMASYANDTFTGDDQKLAQLFMEILATDKRLDAEEALRLKREKIAN